MSYHVKINIAELDGGCGAHQAIGWDRSFYQKCSSKQWCHILLIDDACPWRGQTVCLKLIKVILALRSSFIYYAYIWFAPPQLVTPIIEGSHFNAGKMNQTWSRDDPVMNDTAHLTPLMTILCISIAVWLTSLNIDASLFPKLKFSAFNPAF